MDSTYVTTDQNAFTNNNIANIQESAGASQ